MHLKQMAEIKTFGIIELGQFNWIPHLFLGAGAKLTILGDAKLVLEHGGLFITDNTELEIIEKLL